MDVYAQRYEVVRAIARGGMADVYLARDTKLNRLVAIKVLFAELSRDPAFVERFRREAQSAANLNHPNIVSIFDWGQEGDTYFIVMEYVDGRALRDLIQSDGPLPFAEIADIGAAIAGALAFAHDHGVVHRDVKPGNVLITPAGQVKVTDFGIARAGAGDALTRTGSVMGTATYFSPEQAQGLPVDGRSDVYSLGVVLYEMATGSAPFHGDSPVAVAYQHVREPLPDPTTRRSDLPGPLAEVIATALAKDPNRRYPSADALRADLVRFRRGERVAGAPLTAQVATVEDPTQALTAAAPAATSTFPTLGGPGLPPHGSHGADRRGRGALVGLLVVLLLVAAGALAYLGYRLTRADSGAQVTVPHVIGSSEAAASARLRSDGLTPNVSRVPNESVRVGQVFAQNPAADTKVSKSSTVTIEVSDGAGLVKVPSVDTETFDDASASLKAAGFNVQREDVANDTVGAGLVVRTSPAGGQRAEKGSSVSVFVSAGPAPVTVPDVTDNDQVAATQTLVSAGFTVKKTTQPSDTVTVGAVIATVPAANSPAPRGAAIMMIVSTGPTQITVPTVVGFTQTNATNALSQKGFEVTVNLVPSTPANNGLVIDQSPEGGTPANKGSPVTITVGTGLPSGSSTSTTASTTSP